MHTKNKPTHKIILVAGILIAVVVVSIGGFLGYRKWQQKKIENSKISATNVQEVQINEPKESPGKRPATYEVYDPAKLSLAADGKVVLFFNASWSKTSKMLDKDLKEKTNKLPNNFTVLSVDYNKNAALRKKYAVTLENTFVQVDASGAVINKWAGSEDLAEIIALAK